MPKVPDGRGHADAVPGHDVAGDQGGGGPADGAGPGSRLFTSLGLDLSSSSGQQVGGRCPFCGKESKFWVNSQTGQWSCLVCGRNGNPLTFARSLWEESRTARRPASDCRVLVDDRNLLRGDTLSKWGICRSLVTDEWLVPAFSADGKLHNLYRWTKLKDERGRWSTRLLPCPGLWPDGKVHGLFGVNLFDKKRKRVLVAEGAWDAVCLWESMVQVKEVAGELMVTGSEASSLLGGSNVLAVPGANVFQDGWLTLLSGREVTLLYDNDHRREVSGRVVDGAGTAGARKAAQMMASMSDPPSSVRWLEWGPGGVEEGLKDGFDLRDLLSPLPTAKERARCFVDLCSTNVRPIPEEWVSGRSPGSVGNGSLELEPLSCSSWSELVGYWERALVRDDGTTTWSPSGTGLDHALGAMLATVISTDGIDDQLWIKVQGPASTGKSLLADALRVSRRFVKPVSTLRGLHSGYQTDATGKEDNSLFKQCIGKTMVIKDGDTLMQSPNLMQILSEFRDAYDKNCVTSYRNLASRSYSGANMTVILCGTGSLRLLDKSELGPRFLTVVVMDGIDEALESEVALAVAERAARNMGKVSNCSAESKDDPKISLAKRATGGFVEHLREGAADLLGQVAMRRDDLVEFTRLATFTAYMRARESTSQDEVKERELAPRLTVQLTRMAGCLAAVVGAREVTRDVMDRVRRTAVDSSSGKTLDLCRWLFDHHSVGGLPTEQVAVLQGEQQGKSLKYLQFLRAIGAVELNAGRTSVGYRPRPKWRLTERVVDLGRGLI